MLLVEITVYDLDATPERGVAISMLSPPLFLMGFLSGGWVSFLEGLFATQCSIWAQF